MRARLVTLAVAIVGPLGPAAARLSERPDDLDALQRVVHVEQRRGRALAGQAEREAAAAAFTRSAAAARTRFDRTGDVLARMELGTSRCNLGDALVRAGDLVAGRERLGAVVRDFRELGDAHPSAPQYRRYAEGLIDRARLLLGERTPRGPAEHLEVAYQRSTEEAFAAAVESFAAALEDPALAGDLERANLYDAACAAARAAAAAEGRTADGFAGRALEWLADDVRRRRRRVAAGGAGAASLARHLEWARAGDPDLAAIRDDPRFAEVVGAP